jgi:YjjG family noncanonical pyrimidine nucleotidase
MKISKKYKYILIDLDDTLLDFKKAEQFAFRQLLKINGIKNYERYFNLYHNINLKLWGDFEKGLISKEKLAVERFALTFTKHSKLNYQTMNEQFMMFISTASFPIEGSYELLKYLKNKYKVFVVSNGIKNLQILRLNHSRMMELVDGYVFSEETSAPKPHLAYFDFLFKKYKLKFNDKDYIIIGDSLTSDIQGALNLGIDSIWFNPKLEKLNSKSTYTVANLEEIIKIL